MLKIAYVSPWNTIHPGLQHTLIGDLVLSNQFEALVGMNEAGAPIPLAAKEWEVSSDLKLFRFKIDNNLKFSDGVSLSAKHFKEAWESALMLNPTSANSSLLDVLYKISGFSDFKKTGKLSGLKVIDDSTLEIHFATPFRMALEHLQGNRFAVFREKEGKFLGTGYFNVTEIGENHVQLFPRSDRVSEGVPQMDLRYLPIKEAIAKLRSGEVDVIPYLVGLADESEQLDHPQISLLLGQDAVHLAVGLNSTRGSIFNNVAHRRAFQFLVHKALTEHRQTLPKSSFFELDPQVYMPFQAGRLDDEQVQHLILDGASGLDALIAASKKHPITVLGLKSHASILAILQKTGLVFSDETALIDIKDHIKIHYAEAGPDALIFGFGIASGDPDGIYHKLGKSGAIRTPYVYSDLVGTLLEEGRKLTEIDRLDAHYKRVSQAILSEVPMVHIGFGKAIMAYRNDKVYLDTGVLRRNQGQLHFLRAK